MTRIEAGDDGNGLVALVIAVVEILVEVLEREAVRRMESGTLSDEEVDRLGRRLAHIEAELDSLKEETGVAEDTDALRGQLGGLVEDAIHRLDDPAEVNR
jgi:hypothetical protein